MSTRLQKYLSENCLSREWFCEQVGVGKVALCRYLRGTRIPSKAIMQKIYTVTGGHVRPDHFYDLPKMPKVSVRAQPDTAGDVTGRSVFVVVGEDSRSVPLLRANGHTHLPADVPLFPEVFSS